MAPAAMPCVGRTPTRKMVVVAAAILKRWQVVPIGVLQLGMIGFYTAFLTVTSPELWLDPFGPLSKNLPLIGAVLALMAIDEEPRCSTPG